MKFGKFLESQIKEKWCVAGGQPVPAARRTERGE